MFFSLFLYLLSNFVNENVFFHAMQNAIVTGPHMCVASCGECVCVCIARWIDKCLGRLCDFCFWQQTKPDVFLPEGEAVFWG